MNPCLVPVRRLGEKNLQLRLALFGMRLVSHWGWFPFVSTYRESLIG